MAASMLEKVARGAVAHYNAEDLEVAIADLNDYDLAELYEKAGVLSNVAEAHLRVRIETLVKAGESQRALGDLFGVNHKTISRWCQKWGIVPKHGNAGNDNRHGAGRDLGQGAPNEDEDAALAAFEAGTLPVSGEIVDEPAPTRNGQVDLGFLQELRATLQVVEVKTSKPNHELVAYQSDPREWIKDIRVLLDKIERNLGD